MVVTIHYQTIEGLRVHLSRLRLLSAAAVIPLVLLAGCGSAETAKPASALDVITVAGTDKAPTLSFKTKPMTVKATTTKVIKAGTGAKVTKANSIQFNYALFNGKDGSAIESNFGKQVAAMDLSSATVLPGLSKGLLGQPVGSRVMVAIPPADAFGAQGAPPKIGATDTLVFLIDLVSAYSSTAIGAPVPPKAGLPTVTVDGAKAAQITVPKTAAPTTLIIQPLIKGAGPVVKKGQILQVNYTGVLWKDGKKFDASADRGTPLETPIGVGKVVSGWDKGLVGQTVGSRILLVVPPADGYGAAGKPPIGGKDTMVFVIDILTAAAA